MPTLCHNIKLKVGQTLRQHCPRPFPWNIVTNVPNYVPFIFIHYASISLQRKFHIKVWNYTCNFVLLMLNGLWRIMLFNIEHSKLHFAQWLSHSILITWCNMMFPSILFEIIVIFSNMVKFNVFLKKLLYNKKFHKVWTTCTSSLPFCAKLNLI
jgi:hypothetical protein